jgi:hypothetical protein
VVHYCIGGLEIDVDPACLATNGKSIPGLSIAGEVADGGHGNDRLVGNPMLGGGVFGRVAGRHCAKDMRGNDFEERSIDDSSSGGLTGVVEGSKLAGGPFAGSTNKPAAPGCAAPAAGGSGSGGGYSIADVAKHTSKESCCVVVAGQVLDVTDSREDHSGGGLAIPASASKTSKGGSEPSAAQEVRPAIVAAARRMSPAAPASASQCFGFGGFEGRKEHTTSKEGSGPPGKEGASESVKEDFAGLDGNLAGAQ